MIYKNLAVQILNTNLYTMIWLEEFLSNINNLQAKNTLHNIVFYLYHTHARTGGDKIRMDGKDTKRMSGAKSSLAPSKYIFQHPPSISLVEVLSGGTDSKASSQPFDQNIKVVTEKYIYIYIYIHEDNIENNRTESFIFFYFRI